MTLAIEPVPLVLNRDDVVLSRRLNRLVTHGPGGEVLRTLPAIRVSEVVVTGDATVTAQAMQFLLTRGIPLVFLDRLGRARGRLEPAGARAAHDRQVQLAASLDADRCLGIARALVDAKLRAQRANLRRRLRWVEDPQGAATLRQLERHRRASADAATHSELLGHEGAAAATYYQALRRQLPASVGFGRREPRDLDLVNNLVNYAAGVLRETVRAAVVTVGLDPAVGFLHATGPSRPSLVLDLMEEWRPLLVDAVVVRLVRLRRVTPDMLVDGPDRPHLDRLARQRLVERVTERLAAPLPTRDGADLSTREAVLRQVVRLRHTLRTAQPYRPVAWP